MGTQRLPFVAGNWKMNLDPAGAAELAVAVRAPLDALSDRVEAAVCPAFVALMAVRSVLEGSQVKLGAQNAYHVGHGAFTGEVSAEMLKGLCDYVIVGHSERRQYFGETDASVFLKTQAVLKSGLGAIVCIGERLDERDAGRTTSVIRSQLHGSLGGLDHEILGRVTIAYEPVWAIGTGRAASAEQAQEVAGMIREELRRMFGSIANETRIQYGGSVNPANCSVFFAQPDIDGALVGGASLKATDFVAIVRGCAQQRAS
ncbi:MAG: triose-phosphate isomerase [Chloroflexi bacterium]|nr:triose-phosphate isomerase [Chloroflexota bacterium]